MAEYIDKKYLDRKFQIDMMCLWSGTIFDTKRIIDSLPTADVIERSKYIELLKENERLRGDLEFKSEALNSIGQIHKEYVSKIDKAIEEMESYEEEVYHRDTEKKEYACVYHCLEILKRNIGE